jgi:nucleoside-diphosphate-sugar epimerase
MVAAAGTRIGILGANGDLGRQLVHYLAERGAAVTAAARTPLVGLPHRVEQLTFPNETAAVRTFLAKFSNCTAIINCIGLPYRRDEDEVYRLASLESNFIIPVLIAIEVDALRIPTLHMSSGRLDHTPIGRREFPSTVNLLAALSSAGKDAHKWLASFARKVSNTEHENSYDLAKRAQECAVSSCTYSKSVRVSNFFGPNYTAPRLIPRLIQNRLFGGHITLADEERNYISGQDLNRFLFALCCRFADVADTLVWAYGTHNITVGEISERVSTLLPACYGTVSIQNPVKLSPASALRHTGSYFDDTEKELSFPSTLSLTVRFWRRALQHHVGERSAPVTRRSSIIREIPGGGSIAVKHLVSCGAFNVCLDKSAKHLGFEGAGTPKLRAEANFYQSLQNTPALAELYVKYVDSKDDDNGVTLRLEYFANGWTIADQLTKGRLLPEDQLKQFIGRVFEAGYHSHLRPLSQVDSISALDRYYLDRAIERLQNFLDAMSVQNSSAVIRRVFSATAAGESFRIDGTLCRNPLSFLTFVRDHPLAFTSILPRVEGLCSHGDLTILNILFDEATCQFRLIDPRGRVGMWDPAYDLSKLMFSLSGFASIIHNQLSFRYVHNGYRLFGKDETANLRRLKLLRNKWHQWVQHSPIFLKLREHEPHIYHRILFGEAIHYLADVPYRYAIDRSLTDACTTLLLGTLRLEQTAQHLERFNG